MLYTPKKNPEPPPLLPCNGRAIIKRGAFRIAAEAIGIGFAALRRVVIYAGERKVFGRPIGKN
jgi:alkylation response protein AidB-like acyl-CoA dehydrogenase